MKLTPKEGCAIMNMMVAEITGVNNSISTIDTSSFVAAAETIMPYGKENVLNALSYALGRTFIRVEAYDEKFKIINESDESLYDQITREIFYYDDKALPAGNWNTYEELADNATEGYTNLANGYDNGSNSGASVASMWEQHRKMPVELYVCGQVVWDYGITLDDDAFKVVFTDPANFAEWVSGIMTECENDIKSEKEAFRRAVFLNRLGMAINDESNYGTAVNLTKAYNDEMGTEYTSEELRTTYLKSFLEFFVAYVKNLSNMMTYRSKLYHNPHTKTVNDVEYNVLMATSKAKQKLVLYNPLFIKSEAYVMPEIFNPKYLDVSNYEGVDFWQNLNDGAAINVTPSAIVDGVQTAGDTVDIPFVVGALFHGSGVKCGTFLESADSTPHEARKKYRNIWWHIAKKSYNNDIFPFVCFYMADETEPEPEPTPEPTPEPEG